VNLPPLEAFELIAHAEQLQVRLEFAAAEISKLPGLAEEKSWLEVAQARLLRARAGLGDLPLRALRLSELEPSRGEYTRNLQATAVDALERLHAGITFAGGQRAPLLEALYWKLKVPALRRCDRMEFEKFWRDFEKRLSSSYAVRMLAEPNYKVVEPAIVELKAAVASWLDVFSTKALDEKTADGLRAELAAAAERLSGPFRQARALAPLKGIVDASLIEQKPKRKGAKAADDEDKHALLDETLPDRAQPSQAEAEEIAESRKE
jgi:hypothetical protein